MTNELLKNGRLTEMVFWRIFSTVTAAGLIGLFALAWTMNAKLAAIEATMVTESELRETLAENVPPPWFREQVARLETRLQDHIEDGRE